MIENLDKAHVADCCMCLFLCPNGVKSAVMDKSTHSGYSHKRNIWRLEVESVSDNPHYNGARHRAWAEKVLRRAGYRCEECRRYGRTDKDGLPVRATVAHHIQHLDEHPELAYDLANGRALCEACHNKMHPEKGRKSGRFRGGGRTI